MPSCIGLVTAALLNEHEPNIGRFQMADKLVPKTTRVQNPNPASQEGEPKERKSGLIEWVKNLFGGRVRVVDDPQDSRDKLLRDMVGSSDGSVLGDLHKYSTEREGMIGEYKEMLTDSVTLAAVELIAEDASIIDMDTGLAAWVTCQDDPDFGDQMTQWLTDSFKINDMIYPIAFNIVAFGECFINTNFSNEVYREHFTLGDFFTIADPLECIHLFRFGAPLGYAVRESEGLYTYGDSDTILPEKSYIHFISDRGQDQSVGDSDDGVVIRYGTSFLEAAKYSFRQKKLMDDLIVLARLTRSAFYRIFSVEVGNATSQDTARMMREVRTAINSKQSLNVAQGVFSSQNAPMITGGNIYVPVRNGLGGISVNEVSTPTEVGNLKDWDTITSQYLGALKVPKQFLGQAEETGGGLNDSTLTQLDIRYARTVKRVQRILREGIRKLVIWKCLIDDVMPPEFDIQMPTILTGEDEKRAATVTAEAERMDKALQMVAGIDPEYMNKANKRELIYFVLHKIFKNDALLDALGYNDPEPAAPEGEAEEGEEDEFGGGFDRGVER